MESKTEQTGPARPIRPLKRPLSFDQLFERRESIGANGRQIVRKMEYRLDAARQTPDFAPYLERWDQGHRKGCLPTFGDFESIPDPDGLAAIHLLDASSSDPRSFRFLKFDRTTRPDHRDLSGTSLAEYPDPMIRNSGIQDYATAPFGERGSIMEVSMTTRDEARRFVRLMLPIGADQRDERSSQLISIVRLLEYKRLSDDPIGSAGLRHASSMAVGVPSPGLIHSVPVRGAARQVLMKHFHNGNQELLADQDLLELLLKQSEDSTVWRELAEALMDEFGSLAAVMAAGNERLFRFRGMTPQALVRLKVARELATRIIRLEMASKPVFSSTGIVLDYCRARMAHETVEHVRFLYLDQKNRLIVDEPIHGGGVASAPVNPRHIVKRAVMLDAQSIIMAHNHPSGDPSPSGADVEVTRALRRASEAVGVRLLDHLIIGRSGHVSLQTLGYLDDG